MKLAGSKQRIPASSNGPALAPAQGPDTEAEALSTLQLGSNTKASTLEICSRTTAVKKTVEHGPRTIGPIVPSQ